MRTGFREVRDDEDTSVGYEMMGHEEAIRIVEDAMVVAREEIPKGAVADYIPELGKADPDQLGICIYPLSGEKICLGDYQTRFTIQSISKIISLCVALELFGPEKLFEKVEAEPSGEAFNSLVELDLNSNKPYNPLINSGALAVAGMLIEEVSFHDMLRFARELCDDDQIVKTLMLICGMYDGSGTYAVEVGIPTKSGVGGGLLAVSDKRAGIGVFGPSLDSKGNSIAGCRLLKEIANKLRLTLFFDTDLLHASRKKYSLNDFPKHIPNLPR